MKATSACSNKMHYTRQPKIPQPSNSKNKETHRIFSPSVVIIIRNEKLKY